MTGRSQPSARELKANLHKRLESTETQVFARNQKRFNRHGVTKAAASSEVNEAKVGKAKGAQGKGRVQGGQGGQGGAGYVHSTYNISRSDLIICF